METSMALGKPLFYMLAQHGPWAYHVRVKGVETMLEVEKWLNNTGRKLNVDYESLVENIEHKNTKKTFVPVTTVRPSGRTRTMPQAVQSVEPILFFNDPSIATYVKLTWGGR